MKRRPKRKGGEAEEFLFDLLSQSIPGLAKTVNSGARHGDKDFGTRHLLVEAKSTKHSSYSVKLDLLQEIETAALRTNKDHILAVLLKAEKPRSYSEDNAFLVMPMELGSKLLRFYYASNEEEEEQEG